MSPTAIFIRKSPNFSSFLVHSYFITVISAEIPVGISREVKSIASSLAPTALSTQGYDNHNGQEQLSDDMAFHTTT